MADQDVTLIDVSFNTEKAVDGLDALIKKSLELAEEKKQLTTTLNNEKKALEEVRKAYADNKIDQTAAKKQMEQLETNIISNTKKLNDMKTAVSENAAQIKAHTTIVNAGVETVESMRAQLALNTKALNKMSVEERTTKESGRLLVTQTKELTDRLKDLEKDIGDTRRNVGNYAEDIEKATSELGGMTGATGQMIKGMSGGIASIKAFNAALMANPFVAIASAILTVISLIGSLMDRNSELAASVKTLLAPIGTLISKILNTVAELFTQVVKVFEWLAEAYVKLYNWLGLIPDTMVEAIERSKQLISQERAIYNAESENIVVLARRRRELEALKNVISDQTKSEAERNQAAKDGLQILDEMRKREKAILVAKYDRLEAEKELNGYESDEKRRERLQALADIEAKEAEYISQRNELISQSSGIEKAAADAAATARENAAKKAAEAKKKAEEKAAKDAENAAKKEAETKKAVQAEILKSYEDGITNLQLRIRESNIGIVDKRKALDDMNTLNQAILEKERYRLQQGLITQQEFDNIKLEQNIAFREKVAELEKQEEEARKNQKSLAAEQERAIEEANITSNFEKLARNLETARQLEVAAAEKVGADVTAIEAKYAKLREDLKKKEINTKLQMTADVAGQISNIMGQESAAGKTFALAQATINTYLGASKAIAQGGIWGVAQAAIVIAAGLKQVASIAKVKEDVPKTNTNVRKYAKGGQIYGPSHAQGGVTFSGSNGQRFEAEGGENVYILNRRASNAINALSALNMEYGGRSFGNSSVYKYADGGGFDVLSSQSLTNLNKAVKKDVDLSPKTIAAIALAFVDGVQNAPNPIVSVQDITDVQQGRTLVIDSATN